MKEWIRNRSSITRWVLVPIVFIVSYFLIHASIIISSWGLSIFEGSDAELNLWIFKNIIASGLSAYGAAILSGSTAPNFQFITTCTFSSIFILGGLFIVYQYFFGNQGVLESDAIWRSLSMVLGATIAIWNAKRNFYEL